MRVVSMFQTAAGAWHWPSILSLFTFAVSGFFLLANLKVNRDDRVRSFEKEQKNIAEFQAAQARIAELERGQRPRVLSEEQTAKFINATKTGPFGPVVLATRTAMPSKEQEDFTMQLRKMLDQAGFGNGGKSDIVNGFSTGIDSKGFLTFISNSKTPPPYFSNLAGGLHELGLISTDVAIGTGNPQVLHAPLYIFIPEK